MKRWMALFFCFAACGASFPPDLARFLGVLEKNEPTVDLRENLKQEPGIVLGKDLDVIAAAIKDLNSGKVEQYMAEPVRTPECHVEFQVTERVPGRCTKLSGSIPACQAEKYICINYNECI